MFPWVFRSYLDPSESSFLSKFKVNVLVSDVSQVEYLCNFPIHTFKKKK